MTAYLIRLGLALSGAMVAMSAPAPTKSPLSIRTSGECTGQSCAIADLSGSSGIAYDGTPAVTGGSDAGDCCVIGYNPSAASALYAATPTLTCSSSKMIKRQEMIESNIAGIKRQSCESNTLVFARGTFEIATLGETVGPSLELGLDTAQPGQWSIQGVDYDASLDGDDCLGLPGGVVGTALIESIVSSCPDTKIVVSGYSEGAMVAHNAVANLSSSALSQVVGVFVFGDPFNGAPIKGYSGPITTYCADGDDVCSGEFVISTSHLSYVGTDTTEAVSAMVSLVG